MRCLEVRRDDLRTTRVVDEPTPQPAPGQALLRIDRFGLSANNITYGVTGGSIGYWGFFPAADGWGRIPVWGFADVVASDVDGIEAGTRVFGYLPMATNLVVEPSRVGPNGFTNGAARRAQLPAVYNRYQRTDADPLYRPTAEDLHAVFVPLFVTSFVLDDFLADNDDFGAQRVLVSSASSKTAAGTALCLARRTGDRPAVVGLTSPANVAFTAGLGVYDEVVVYPDVTTLDPAVPTVFVDVAGDARVREAVHRHLGDALRYSCAVGLSHWDAPRVDGPLPGPKPLLFFAPSQVEKRLADWGPVGYQRRLAEAWGELLDVAGTWVTVTELSGLPALEDAYRRLLDGQARPDEAVVASPEP